MDLGILFRSTFILCFPGRILNLRCCSRLPLFFLLRENATLNYCIQWHREGAQCISKFMISCLIVLAFDLILQSVLLILYLNDKPLTKWSSVQTPQTPLGIVSDCSAVHQKERMDERRDTSRLICCSSVQDMGQSLNSGPEWNPSAKVPVTDYFE